MKLSRSHNAIRRGNQIELHLGELVSWSEGGRDIDGNFLLNCFYTSKKVGYLKYHTIGNEISIELLKFNRGVVPREVVIPVLIKLLQNTEKIMSNQELDIMCIPYMLSRTMRDVLVRLGAKAEELNCSASRLYMDIVLIREVLRKYSNHSSLSKQGKLTNTNNLIKFE